MGATTEPFSTALRNISPGPGEYYSTVQDSPAGPAYSIGGRIDANKKTKHEDAPGPGDYHK